MTKAIVTDNQEVGTLSLVAVRLATADGGLPLPIGVVESVENSRGEDVEAALVHVEELMTVAGADVETILRADGSVAEDFVAAAAERDATMLLVPWDGPVGYPGYSWGRVVDDIGRASSVPTAAVRSNPKAWGRISVAAYFFDWGANNDLRIALGLVDRLAAGGAPVVVCTEDSERVTEMIGDLEADVHTAQFESGRIFAQVEPGDLVVDPLGVARSAGTAGLGRLGRVISGAAVMVVAGPGRLSFGGAAPTGLAGAMVASSR